MVPFWQENSKRIQVISKQNKLRKFDAIKAFFFCWSLFLSILIRFSLLIRYILHIVRRNSCWYKLLELKGLTDSLMSRHYFSTAALKRPSLNQLLTESIPIGGQFQLQTLFSASTAWEKLDWTPFYKHKW